MLNVPQQPSPQPQAPNMGVPAGGPPQAQVPQGQPQPGQPQGQGQMDPGILQALEQKMGSVSPEEQELVKAAVTEYPGFPRAVGVVFGPESEAYFTEIQSQLLGQQTSQPQSSVGPEAAAQASAPGQPQAKATPAGLNVPQGPM